MTMKMSMTMKNMLKMGNLSRRFSHCLHHCLLSSSGPMGVEVALKPSKDPEVENVRIRRQLALSYRLLDRLQLNEGACNHLTAMAPARDGSGQVMLVIPGKLESGAALHWSQVNASSLIGVDAVNNVVEPGSVGGEPESSAACIHLGIRRVLPDAKVIFHTHTDYATALGCLKDPQLLMMHQNGTRFRNKIAFHREYAQPTVVDEGVHLGNSLGDKHILFMCNHGTLVVSPTVHLAFDETYYLERACRNQMLSLASVGGDKSKVAIMPEKMSEDAARFYTAENLDLYAGRHFFAWWNLFLSEQPDVFH